MNVTIGSRNTITYIERFTLSGFIYDNREKIIKLWQTFSAKVKKESMNYSIMTIVSKNSNLDKKGLWRKG